MYSTQINWVTFHFCFCMIHTYSPSRVCNCHLHNGQMNLFRPNPNVHDRSIWFWISLPFWKYRCAIYRHADIILQNLFFLKCYYHNSEQYRTANCFEIYIYFNSSIVKTSDLIKMKPILKRRWYKLIPHAWNLCIQDQKYCIL